MQHEQIGKGSAMKKTTATILREYGPFPEVAQIGGVSFDGAAIWIAAGDRLCAIDPDSGSAVRSFDLPASAGTAFDGRYLYQIGESRIQKIDPEDGRVVSTVPSPVSDASGMAWAEGSLWIGQYRGRRIHEVDPETGAILRSLPSDRFVTGVTWVDGELWHGTWEDDRSDLRRIDPQSAEVLEQVDMPDDVFVSGLESNGGDTFFCGGGGSGKVRAVRRPK